MKREERFSLWIRLRKREERSRRSEKREKRKEERKSHFGIRCIHLILLHVVFFDTSSLSLIVLFFSRWSMRMMHLHSLLLPIPMTSEHKRDASERETRVYTFTFHFHQFYRTHWLSLCISRVLDVSVGVNSGRKRCDRHILHCKVANSTKRAPRRATVNNLTTIYSSESFLVSSHLVRGRPFILHWK